MRVDGVTYKMETPVGKAYVTINTNGGNEPLELFINVGKAGSDVQAMAEGLGRLISLILRIASPVDPHKRAHEVIHQLSGIGGSRHVGFGEMRVKSLPDAIAKVMNDHFMAQENKHTLGSTLPMVNTTSTNGHSNGVNGKTLPVTDQAPHAVDVPIQIARGQQPLFARKADMDLCPSCGDMALAHEEGCKKCYSCGYSEC